MPEKETWDVVIVGGGNNGLGAGAFLSKAGLSCVVLEALGVPGGGATTEEVTLPGFKHNLHACFMLVIYEVFRQLQLDRYGCHIYESEGGSWNVYEDGTCLRMTADMDEMVANVAKFNKHDAQTWRDMATYFKDTAPMWNVGILPVRGLVPSIPFQVLETSVEGRDLLQMIQNSARNVVESLFEDEHIKASLYTYVNQATELPDDVMGTGALVVLRFAQWGSRTPNSGAGIAVGGTGTITRAMQRIIEENKGSVRTNTKVVQIKVDNGLAKSAVTEDGTEFIARKAMISGVNHQIALLDLIGEEHLEPRLAAKIKRWRRGEQVLFTPHLAFDEPLVWKCSDQYPEIQTDGWGVAVYPDPPDSFASEFEDIRAGRVPKDLTYLGAFPTVVDPTQAPPGKATALLWQYVGYELQGGPQRWDEEKDGLCDRMLDLLQKVVKNDLKKIVIGRYVQSPMDVVRRNPSMAGASFCHGSMAQDQTGVFRPFHDYETGRNAAELLLEDLKMKKWWLD